MLFNEVITPRVVGINAVANGVLVVIVTVVFFGFVEALKGVISITTGSGKGPFLSSHSRDSIAMRFCSSL